MLVVGQPAAEVPMLDYQRVSGGLLLQQRDAMGCAIGVADLKIVTRRAPSEAELRDLLRKA